MHDYKADRERLEKSLDDKLSSDYESYCKNVRTIDFLPLAKDEWINMTTQSKESGNELSGHTPGCWELANNDTQVWSDVPRGRICTTENGHEIYRQLNLKERQANARLIAAAPELLEALKEAQQSIRKATDHIKRMEGYTGGCSSSEDFADMHCIEALNIMNRAAAKAEGCSEPKPLSMDKPKRAAIAKAEGK